MIVARRCESLGFYRMVLSNVKELWCGRAKAKDRLCINFFVIKKERMYVCRVRERLWIVFIAQMAGWQGTGLLLIPCIGR